MVGNKVRVELRYHVELALGKFFCIRWHDIWPACARLADHDANVLWAFFHLKRQIQARRHNQVRIGVSYGYLGVKSTDIELRSSKSLLPRIHSSPEADELLVEVYA